MKCQNRLHVLLYNGAVKPCPGAGARPLRRRRAIRAPRTFAFPGAGAAPVYEEEPALADTQQMMQDWLRHRRVLPELLAGLNDGQIGFKPWDGAMTLGKLALHIAGSTDAFVSFAKTGEFARPSMPECTTADDVRRAVDELTAKTQATYASLSDADLEVERDAAHMGLKGPAKMFLAAARDHEVHHKGQLFIYARMADVEKVPFFVSVARG